MEKFAVNIQAPIDLVWKNKEKRIWILNQTQPSSLAIELL
jgi:hypothetical protein